MTVLEPRPGPSFVERVGFLARLPAAVALTTLRHLRSVPHVPRRHETGGSEDVPPALAAEVVDERCQYPESAHGPLFHRTFAVDVRDSDLDAAALVDTLVQDLDRPAPFGLVTFTKTLGLAGALALGDEYRVRMPGPWDGPVRVVHRGPSSYRLATLREHLEAGQIEFRATDLGPGRVRFEIETWSAAGDRWARLLYADLRVGLEVQLALWVQYCARAAQLGGGHQDGPVSARTRRVDRAVVARGA